QTVRNSLGDLSDCASLAGSQIDGSTSRSLLQRLHAPIGDVTRIDEISHGRTISPHPKRILSVDRSADQCGDHLGRLPVEIIIWTVDIRWPDNPNSVPSKFLEIRLPLKLPNSLGDASVTVVLLRHAVPHVVFVVHVRLWIAANAADEEITRNVSSKR